MTSKQNKTLSGTLVSQYDYTVNSIGQRVSRTQSGAAFDGIGYAPGTELPPGMAGAPNSGTSTDTFTYNTWGEVIGSTNSKDASFNRGYDYDPRGNRLTVTENTETKTYASNNLNQYTQITAPSPESLVLSPVYDDDGNMISDGEGKTYTWDCENRLIQVALPNSDIVRYSYDGQSRRVRREHIANSGTETTTYLYDDRNVIAEWHSPNSETQTLKSYLWGLDLSNTLQGVGGVGGLLVSIARNSSTPEDLKTYSFTYDGNGNVNELMDGNEGIQAHYEYDALGKETLDVGMSIQQNIYRFSTKPWDAEVELNYHGYRFYNPIYGRWINRDVIEEDGGENLYVFIENKPVNLVDNGGLSIHVPDVKYENLPQKYNGIMNKRSYLNVKYIRGRARSIVFYDNSFYEFLGICKKYRLEAYGGGFEASVEYSFATPDALKKEKDAAGNTLYEHERKRFDDAYSRFKKYAADVNSYDGVTLTKCDCGTEYANYNLKSSKIYEVAHYYDAMSYHLTTYFENQRPDPKKIEIWKRDLEKAEKDAAASKKALDDCIQRCT